MDGPAKYNFVTEFEEKSLKGFELRYVGLICIAAALVVFVCALLVNAKKADREVEKKLRRELRAQAQNDSTIEVKKAVEVIEEPAAESNK